MLKKPACVVCLVHLICRSIRSVSFNQTHETDRIGQTDEIDQMNKRRGGGYCLAWGGMALIISEASSFAISFKFGR